MGGVTYDSGALIAADRGERRMWVRHAALIANHILPVVPAAVVAEVWRDGARQANLARLLVTCEVEALTDAQARRVGVLAARSGHADIVDLAVLEGAARRGDTIVTCDPRDIDAIAGATGAPVRVEAI